MARSSPLNKDEVITVFELYEWLVDFMLDYGPDGEVWVGDREGLSNKVVSLYRLDRIDVILSPRQDERNG